ncbi:Uncharacterised protein [Chlamydia trachomatis]|nr:Uncharacterised protein [Chlamydia trachomatis]
MPRKSFSNFGKAFSIVCKSARISSVLIVSISSAGSTLPLTCTMSSSLNARTTSQMASASRILARNLLPKPSPSLAPLTIPAISTNVTVAGTIFSVLTSFAKTGKRLSGKGTIPVFGSIVANG